MEIETELTQERLIAQVKNNADIAYADHRLKQESGGIWLCEREGSNRYSFRVVFCPKYVILCGDISPQMLYCNSNNSLTWLLEVSGQLGTLFSTPQIRQDVFFVKDALQACKLKADEASSSEDAAVQEEAPLWLMLQRKFFNDIAQGEDPFEAWRHASHLIFRKSLEDIGMGFGDGMLWQHQALLTFVRLYRAKQSEIPVSRL